MHEEHPGSRGAETKRSGIESKTSRARDPGKQTRSANAQSTSGTPNRATSSVQAPLETPNKPNTSRPTPQTLFGPQSDSQSSSQAEPPASTQSTESTARTADPRPKRADQPALSFAAHNTSFTHDELPALQDVLLLKASPLLAVDWPELRPQLEEWVAEGRQFASYDALLATLAAPEQLADSSGIAPAAPEVAPGGIEHLHNSCHLAAVLTLLAAVPAYRALFDAEHTQLHESRAVGRALQTQLGPLIERVARGERVTAQLLGPALAMLAQHNLLEPQRSAKRPVTEQQQDAGEVMMRILAHVIDDAHSVATNVDRRVTRQFEPAKEGQPAPDDAVERTSEPVIPLWIEGESVTLEHAIRTHFASSRRIHEDDDPNKPKLKNPHQERVEAVYLPSVLTFYVRRAADGANAQGIDAPQEFAFPLEATDLPPELPPPRYRLAGFVLFDNYGSQGGHYVAYTQGAKGGWYESDDTGGGEAPEPSPPPPSSPAYHAESLPSVRAVEPDQVTYAVGQRRAYAMGCLYTYVQVADSERTERVQFGEMGRALGGGFDGISFGSGNDGAASLLTWIGMRAERLPGRMVIRDGAIWINERTAILVEEVDRADKPLTVITDSGTVVLRVAKAGLDLEKHERPILDGLTRTIQDILAQQRREPPPASAQKRRAPDEPALFFTKEQTVFPLAELDQLQDVLMIEEAVSGWSDARPEVARWASERRTFPDYASLRLAIHDVSQRRRQGEVELSLDQLIGLSTGELTELPQARAPASEPEGPPLGDRLSQPNGQHAEHPPGGVVHLHNSCYLASILTLLAGVPAYRALFDPAQHRLERGSPGRRLQRVIAPLLTQIAGGRDLSAEQIGPAIDLLAALGILNNDGGSEPVNRQQQDVGDVLTGILEAVSNQDSDFATHIAETNRKDYHKESTPSVETETSEPVLQLWIEDGQASLEDAIRRHFGTERRSVSDSGKPLDNPHDASVRASWLPSVLTIYVRRSNTRTQVGRPGANSEAIDAPQEFSFPSEAATEGAIAPRYRLQAFVVRTNYEHQGGHYVAYSQGAQGTWFESDDMGGAPPQQGPNPQYVAENSPAVVASNPATTQVTMGQRNAFAMGCLYTYVQIDEGERAERVGFGPVGEAWAPRPGTGFGFDFDDDADTGGGPDTKPDGKPTGEPSQTGQHNPFVHHSFEGWAKRQQMPSNEQVLAAYFRSEVRPAIVALIANPASRAAGLALVEQARELTGELDLPERAKMIEDLARRVNAAAAKSAPELERRKLYARYDELAVHDKQRFSNKTDKSLWKARDGASNSRDGAADAVAINALLAIEAAAKTRGKLKPASLTPSGMRDAREPERTPIPVIVVDSTVEAGLPGPLMAFMRSLYMEWRRGSWIDERPASEVIRGTFTSEEPGSLRSWHQNTEGQLPDISAAPVPDYAHDFHDYYTTTSNVGAKQANKGSKDTGPIGYAEYTGNGILNDVHHCKLVFDYKSGLVFVTASHYEAFTTKDGHFLAKVGKSGKGDHNPWFCFDLSNLDKLATEPVWGGASLGSEARPNAAPTLRALADDPRTRGAKQESKAASKQDSKPASKPAKGKSTAAVADPDLLAQYLELPKAKGSGLPERATHEPLLDQAATRAPKLTASAREQLARYKAIDLATPFATACSNADADAANAVLMIHNLWVTELAQRDEIAAFESIGVDKYLRDVHGGNRKAHGDHLINNLVVAWKKLEGECGVVLLPAELYELFRRMRSFAVEAPKTSITALKTKLDGGPAPSETDDANSQMFQTARDHLLAVLEHAKHNPERAARLVAIGTALRIFFEASRDRVVEHRAAKHPELHLGADKNAKDQEAWRKQCMTQWNELIAQLPALTEYIDRQVAPAPVDWAAEVGELDRQGKAAVPPTPSPSGPSNDNTGPSQPTGASGTSGAPAKGGKPPSLGAVTETWGAKRTTTVSDDAWQRTKYASDLPNSAIHVKLGGAQVRLDRDDIHQILEMLTARLRHPTEVQKTLQDNPQFNRLVRLLRDATADYGSDDAFVEFQFHNDTFYANTENHYIHPRVFQGSERVRHDRPLADVEKTHTYQKMYQGLVGKKQVDNAALINLFARYVENGLTGEDEYLKAQLHPHLATIALAVYRPEVRRNHLSLVINEMLTDLVRRGQLSFSQAFGGDLHPTARGGGENQTQAPHVGGMAGTNTYNLEAGVAIAWLLGCGQAAFSAAPHAVLAVTSAPADIQDAKQRVLELLTMKVLMKR